MALLGSGLMVVATDVTDSGEADFNRWYDREHLAERVSVPGFRGARRFIAAGGTGPRYLTLYELETVEVLDSPDYVERHGTPTPWSQRVLKEACVDPQRLSARLSLSMGLGRGAGLAFTRFRPDADDDVIHGWLTMRLAAALAEDGVLSASVLTGVPHLTGRYASDGRFTADPELDQWLLLVEGQDAQAALATLNRCLPEADLRARRAVLGPRGAYRLLWDLTRDTLPGAG